MNITYLKTSLQYLFNASFLQCVCLNLRRHFHRNSSTHTLHRSLNFQSLVEVMYRCGGTSLNFSYCLSCCSQVANLCQINISLLYMVAKQLAIYPVMQYEQCSLCVRLLSYIGPYCGRGQRIFNTKSPYQGQNYEFVYLLSLIPIFVLRF